MKIIKCVSVFWIVAIMFCGEVFSNEREIIANYVTKKPKIDGKLDDEVWENGLWFTDFVLISNTEKLAEVQAEVQTEFQIAYDDHNLYLAARMNEPSGQLKIEEFRRDGAVSRDDHLEIMIDPSGDKQEYFHFMINAIGIQFDARQRFGGEFYDVDWNAKWDAATIIGSKQWTLEVAIPFSSFSFNKEPKNEWLINIARRRCAGKQDELSSFSLVNGSLYCIQKFSKLFFPKDIFDKFYWKIKGPSDYHVEADKGDWILTGKVQINNATQKNHKFKILFRQINQKGEMIAQMITDSLSSKGHKEYSFKFPIERYDPLKLQIDVVNASDLKDVYKSKKTVLNVDYNLMNIEVMSPFYHNSIYASEDIYELKLFIDLLLTQKVLVGGKLYLKLIREKTNNVVSEWEYTDLAKSMEINFPLGDISIGNYILEGVLVNSQGSVLAQSTQTIKKLRHENNEWRLDSTGALLHNGVPFLPQGWLKIVPEEQQYNSSIYNTVFMPLDLTQDEVKIKKYLDYIQKCNSYAVAYPYVSTEMVNSVKHIGRLLTEKEIQAIQQRIKALKKHPALMAWVIADQPEFEAVLPERLKQVYSIIKEEDPFHPTVIVNSGLKGIMKYWGMADIRVVTAFIPFMKGEEMTESIDWTNYLFEANTGSRNKSAFWAGLQMYDKANVLESMKLLSFIEMRNLFYQVIISEIKGFFWHDYQYVYNYPEMKLSADYLAKELYVLKDAILAPKLNVNVNVKASDKNDIVLSQKKVGDDLYIFAVNSGGNTQDVQLESDLFKELSELYVLSENRIVKINNNEFTDEFEPYATHIYSTKEYRGKLTLLNDIEQELHNFYKTRKKEGNLAFSDTGIKIKASGGNELINNINDGVVEGLIWKGEEGLPQWIEMSWPSPVRMEKAIIFSDTIEHAKVQILQDGNWVDIGDFHRRSSVHLRACFPEQELSQLRILITAKKPGVKNITISEIEVYNRWTKVSY